MINHPSRAVLGLSGFLIVVVSASSAGFTQDLNLSIELGTIAAEDEQTVEPGAALFEFGFGVGAAWKASVEADPNYAGDDAPCPKAIRELYRVACRGTSNCAIEDNYQLQCVDDDSRDAECVKVVDDYVGSCFGTNCTVTGWQPGIVFSLEVRSSTTSAVCSGSTVRKEEFPDIDWNASPDSLFASVLPITAAHCVQNGADSFVFHSDIVGQLELPINDRWIGMNGVPADASILFPDPRRVQNLPPNYLGLGASVNAPTSFAKTVFLARNALIAKRNVIAERNGEERKSEFVCDSSPLCTVIGLTSGMFVHTCQSTKSGSGGALLQHSDPDEETTDLRLVGINQGSSGQGRVTSNRMSTLRSN